jgi:hypothetical protein
MRPDGAAAAAPTLDHDLVDPLRGSTGRRVEGLGVQQLVPELGSVAAIARIASATGVPRTAATSTWRSLATISSGLCFVLRGIERSSSSAKAETWGGPLQRGQARFGRRSPRWLAAGAGRR